MSGFNPSPHWTRSVWCPLQKGNQEPGSIKLPGVLTAYAENSKMLISSRILVINDDQSILDLFSLLLKAEGYEVFLSMITYEDVSDVEQLRPALIILDFKIGP